MEDDCGAQLTAGRRWLYVYECGFKIWATHQCRNTAGAIEVNCAKANCGPALRRSTRATWRSWSKAGAVVRLWPQRLSARKVVIAAWSLARHLPAHTCIISIHGTNAVQILLIFSSASLSSCKLQTSRPPAELPVMTAPELQTKWLALKWLLLAFPLFIVS